MNMSNINQKAMLIRLHIRRWGGVKTDRQLSRKVEISQHAEAGTVRTVKELIPRFNTEFHLIDQIAQHARLENKAMTFPGFQDGERILTGKMFFRHSNIMGALKEAFNKATNRLVEAYPEIYRQAPERMAGMYKASDFPPVDQIASRFAFEIRRGPMPSTRDWRLDDVGQDQIDEWKIEVEKELKDTYNECHMEVYSRMADALKRLSTQAKAYKAHKPNGNTLSDAMFDDLKQMAEILPLLNMEDDPVINNIAENIMRDIIPLEPKIIRRNEGLRKQIAELSDSLLEQVE
jgi:hypothetical protein